MFLSIDEFKWSTFGPISTILIRVIYYVELVKKIDLIKDYLRFNCLDYSILIKHLTVKLDELLSLTILIKLNG